MLAALLGLLFLAQLAGASVLTAFSAVTVASIVIGLVWRVLRATRSRSRRPASDG